MTDINIHTYWYGENSSGANERITRGMAVNMPFRGRKEHSLSSMSKVFNINIEGAMDKAEKAAHMSGFSPMVSCIRVPDRVFKKEVVLNHVVMLDPRLDPLSELLSMFFADIATSKANPNSYTLSFEKYMETIAHHLALEQDVFNIPEKLLAVKNMFFAACRYALSRQSDWEALVRTELARLESDNNWLVSDGNTKKYVKPLPTVLRVEPYRDYNTVQHTFKHSFIDPYFKNDLFTIQTDRIGVGFDKENSAHFDFIFTIDAVWYVNVNTNPSKVKKYNLGIVYGVPHIDFLKQWTLHIGSTENIVYTDRRSHFT